MSTADHNILMEDIDQSSGERRLDCTACYDLHGSGDQVDRVMLIFEVILELSQPKFNILSLV